MEELSNENKVLIEVELYREVMLCIESYYDYKKSEKLTKLEGKEMLVLRDKSELYKKVVEIIKKFSKEKNIKIDVVKEYFLDTLEKEVKKNKEKENTNDWEEIEAIGIISLNESEFEER